MIRSLSLKSFAVEGLRLALIYLAVVLPGLLAAESWYGTAGLLYRSSLQTQLAWLAFPLINLTSIAAASATAGAIALLLIQRIGKG
jgi:hypothetical protein